MDDPHLRATGFFDTLDDPAMGTLRMTGAPVRFDGQRAASALPPRLGQHTRSLLGEAGLSGEQIDELGRTGAAYCASPATNA